MVTKATRRGASAVVCQRVTHAAVRTSIAPSISRTSRRSRESSTHLGAELDKRWLVLDCRSACWILRESRTGPRARTAARSDPEQDLIEKSQSHYESAMALNSLDNDVAVGASYDAATTRAMVRISIGKARDAIRALDVKEDK
jgi:hypothetical protein